MNHTLKLTLRRYTNSLTRDASVSMGLSYSQTKSLRLSLKENKASLTMTPLILNNNLRCFRAFHNCHFKAWHKEKCDFLSPHDNQVNHFQTFTRRFSLLAPRRTQLKKEQNSFSSVTMQNKQTSNQYIDARSYSDSAPSKFSIQNPVYAQYLNSLVEEFDALQASESRGSPQEVSRLNFLRTTVGAIRQLQDKYQEMLELQSLMEDEQDAEMKKLMESEIGLYSQNLEHLEDEVADVLVGVDPAENSDITLEVTAGVGGQEAMLFCQEMYTMYCNYAVRRGWRLDEMSSEDSELGGARRASVEISGEGVFGHLKHEGGVHRVQRVPRTEKAGRIHTSTITVSVMPLPKEIDIQLDQKDLKVETFRNSGPGGQSVNTTDSAVRITHIPSGMVAEAKEERSQIKNRDIALKKLRQRMYETILDEQQAEIRASRKLQEGTRGRSEKIRTYNFQQDRVTDHRTRESVSNLGQLMSVGGEGLDELIEGLCDQERLHTLELMLEGWLDAGKLRKNS